MVLLTVALWPLTFAGSANAQISLPNAPRVIPPPPMTEKEWQNDRNRMRDIRRQRDSQDRVKKELKQDVENKETILSRTLQPRDRSLMLELSLVLPTINTTGLREGYTTELNAHFNIFVRHGGASKDGKTGLWYGFRVAPFSGTGIYREIHGRYGFTYFGPMIGVGSLEAMPQDGGRSVGPNHAKAPKVGGWVATFGIAAQSRIEGIDKEDHEKVDDEFNGKNIGFDAPGVWAEARSLHVYHGALGLQLFAGIQTGRQKQFFYLGLGVGGWR